MTGEDSPDVILDRVRQEVAQANGDAAQDQPDPAREELGRRVRETWLRWARQQPDPKDSWLLPWEGLDDGQREVDMLIGEAMAAAERERLAALAEARGHELARQSHTLLNSDSPEDRVAGVRAGDAARAVLEAAAFIREEGRES